VCVGSGVDKQHSCERVEMSVLAVCWQGNCACAALESTCKAKLPSTNPVGTALTLLLLLIHCSSTAAVALLLSCQQAAGCRWSKPLKMTDAPAQTPLHLCHQPEPLLLTLLAAWACAAWHLLLLLLTVTATATGQTVKRTGVLPVSQVLGAGLLCCCQRGLLACGRALRVQGLGQRCGMNPGGTRAHGLLPLLLTKSCCLHPHWVRCCWRDLLLLCCCCRRCCSSRAEKWQTRLLLRRHWLQGLTRLTGGNLG
jgi:hypothetical protein